MNVGVIHSSESRKCSGCRKKTGQYKVYDQSEITIQVPLCNDCYDKVDVKNTSKSFLTALKKEINAQMI